MRKILVVNVILVIISFVLLVFSMQKNVQAAKDLNSYQSKSYQLAWPGILPDNRFFKLKVLRNKVIEKMITDPVKKVEFDLIMADKTIYASELLVRKGKIALAQETILKGENYYSNLVQHYNQALLQQKKIPQELDKKISLAALKHQEVFSKLEQD